MPTLKLFSVLLFKCRPSSDDDETTKKSVDIIIDDITWLASIMFILILITVFYCMSDYGTQTTQKKECCCKDNVIHVCIDPRDTVKKYDSSSHLTRIQKDQYYPSAPPRDDYTDA
jgi:hypothetical protein